MISGTEQVHDTWGLPRRGTSCTCMDCCEAGTWECLNNQLLCSTEPGGSAYPCEP